MKIKILISACLMGHKVRYSGSEKAHFEETLRGWQEEQRLVTHCPELAAGLSIPRLPAEIRGGTGHDVMSNRASIIESDGRDVTAHYQLAAWLALKAAQESGCQVAILTDGSPTCGSREIYDGHFSGQRRAGMGVAAALLQKHGVQVFSDTQLAGLIAWVKEKENDSV